MPQGRTRERRKENVGRKQPEQRRKKPKPATVQSQTGREEGKRIPEQRRPSTSCSKQHGGPSRQRSTKSKMQERPDQTESNQKRAQKQNSTDTQPRKRETSRRGKIGDLPLPFHSSHRSDQERSRSGKRKEERTRSGRMSFWERT